MLESFFRHVSVLLLSPEPTYTVYELAGHSVTVAVYSLAPVLEAFVVTVVVLWLVWTLYKEVFTHVRYARSRQFLD